jgi:hypothetical protein
VAIPSSTRITGDLVGEVVPREAKLAEDHVVLDGHPGLADRPDGQLLAIGRPDLAHQHDVQLSRQRSRDLGGHGHTTAGQSHHDRVSRPHVFQARGQHPASVGTISEAHGITSTPQSYPLNAVIVSNM